MQRKPSVFLAATLLLVALALTGYWMLFSSFAVYDDEGYILISVREYFAHGKLYETVYSQYGPAFYVLLDFLQHVIGGPVDHIGARLLTLVCWVGTAAFCAGLVWRETTSRSLSLFTLGATFLYLYFITDEPFHPGSSIIFVVAGSLYWTSRMITVGQLSGAAAIAGCTGAWLLLTKINVGTFYVASVTAWAINHATANHFRRYARAMAVAGLTAMALALMHPLWRETWVQIYLVLFAAGVTAMFVTMRGESLLGPGVAGRAIAAGILTGGALLLTVWLRGTTVAGLVEGVVSGPLRHPSTYSFPVDWRPGSLPLAGFSLGLAIAFPGLDRRFPDGLTRLIVGLRLIFGIGLVVGVALLMNFRAVGAIFSYVAPLIWIWIVPLKGVAHPPGVQRCRSLLGAVLIGQYLHAFPVGGSQESWGTFLFIPLTACGLGDVRRWLALHSSPTAATGREWRMVSTVISATIIAKMAWTATVAGKVYGDRLALGLPGATLLHLPEPQRVTYRILALNAAANTDVLFSTPGMFSFNLWADIPPPTEKNTTLWFALLNEVEQRKIIEHLDRTPRAGLIVQNSLIELMRANGIPIHGVLWDYLIENFDATFRSDGFAFCVRKGRTVAPLNIATVTEPRAADTASVARVTTINFCMAHEGKPIAAIEVHQGGRPVPALVLDSLNADARLGSINSAGQPLVPPSKSRWPLDGHGLVRVLVQFDRHELALAASDTILYLKGLKGEDLGQVRIGE